MLPGSSRSVDSVASVVCTGPGIGPLSQASVCYGEPSTITTNINSAWPRGPPDIQFELFTYTSISTMRHQGGGYHVYKVFVLARSTL